MSEQAVRLGIPAVQIEMPQIFRDEITAPGSDSSDNALFVRFAQALLNVYLKVIEPYSLPPDAVAKEWIVFPVAKQPPSLGALSSSASSANANSSAALSRAWTDSKTNDDDVASSRSRDLISTQEAKEPSA